MFSLSPRRLTRHALAKRELSYYLWRFGANARRTYRALAAPRRFPESAALAQELTERGIVAAPSGTFLTEDGQRALARASADIVEISRRDAVQSIVAGGAAPIAVQKRFRVDLISADDPIAADSPLLRLALDEKLLEIVASYLGLWPCLHSVSAWLNYPTTDDASTSQLWHRDPEDLKLVKVFIYLADVDEQCGPFTFIPRTHPFGADAAKAGALEQKKRIPDKLMARVFPPSSWRVCTGPANTMILADTLGYHRGGKPTVGQRILLTLTYTSGAPFVTGPARILGPPAWASRAIQAAAIRLLLEPQPGPAPPRKMKTKTKKKTTGVA